jgi:tRNA A-37 threonylcarbamoyl transferase component Bud32
MAQGADLVGRTIGGRFRLTGLLGQGAMAAVYRGEQDAEPREVAVKVMHAHLASDTTILKRFRREARASSVLDHPNVVRIVDFGVEGALAYIAMELLVGHDLFDVLMQERRLPQVRAVRIVREVARALAAAHERGIIHRDLKPENVMLVPSPSAPGGDLVKVLDFGIAKVLEQEHDILSTHTGLTSVGSVVGTPSYMSPEQCQGLVIDARSDLYACGILLYQLVCGRPPFMDDDAVAVMIAHVREVPLPPSQRVPGLSPEVERVILKALAKGPKERHQNAAELEADLSAVLASLEGGTVAATSPPPPAVEAAPEPAPAAFRAPAPPRLGAPAAPKGPPLPGVRPMARPAGASAPAKATVPAPAAPRPPLGVPRFPLGPAAPGPAAPRAGASARPPSPPSNRPPQPSSQPPPRAAPFATAAPPSRRPPAFPSASPPPFALRRRAEPELHDEPTAQDDPTEVMESRAFGPAERETAPATPLMQTVSMQPQAAPVFASAPPPQPSFSPFPQGLAPGPSAPPPVMPQMPQMPQFVRT